MNSFVRNPHTLEDSWWDGPKRFQYINRNIISSIQHEGIFKFIKIFAPLNFGLDIGGFVENSGERTVWSNEEEPYALKLNIKENCDIRADATRIPFLDKTFGYLVSFHTLEHIKGEVKDILKEWLRVLVPDGLLAIVMPDKHHFLHNSRVEEGTIMHRRAYYELEPKELLNYFNNLNVEILLFDTRKNNFDFEIVVRKRSKT